MPARLTAIQMLDREFLTIRCRLLDVAAAFDRIDRAGHAEKAQTDFRYASLMEGAKLLADPTPDRAERIQLLISDSYDESWRAWMPHPSQRV